LLKETTGGFDGARTHDLHITQPTAPRRPLTTLLKLVPDRSFLILCELYVV